MNQFDTITRILDQEFFGPTANGEAFLPLLNRLTFDQVMDKRTWERYSVVEIAHHVAYWKYELVRFLGKSDLKPVFELADFPPIQSNFSQTDWSTCMAYLKSVHSAVSQAILALNPEDLERSMPDDEGSMTLGEYLLWLTTHDTYHTAQIRSMGLEGIRQGKVS